MLLSFRYRPLKSVISSPHRCSAQRQRLSSKAALNSLARKHSLGQRICRTTSQRHLNPWERPFLFQDSSPGRTGPPPSLAQPLCETTSRLGRDLACLCLSRKDRRNQGSIAHGVIHAPKPPSTTSPKLQGRGPLPDHENTSFPNCFGPRRIRR